jgi:hypothetical protein
MSIPTPYSFPFGQPLQPLDGGVPGNRDCLVIGSMPAALAIRWRVPGGKLVQGFVVDNEPSPYWDGHDQDARIATWRQTVCWQDNWGEAAPTRQNGHHGQWLALQVLAPLHLTRDRVCASYLVDSYHANAAARHRIDEHYRPAIDRLGLRPCVLPDQPGNDVLVHEAMTRQRDRLLGLIRSPSVTSLITLGTAACRAMRELLGPAAAQISERILGDGPDYGQPQTVVVDGRSYQWHAFISPAAPASMQHLHATWMQRVGARLQQRHGAFK